MEIEIIKTNKKIFFVTVVIVFSFIVSLSYSITKNVEKRSTVFEGKYTVNIEVSGLEEDKYLTGKSDGDYSLALATEKYEFVNGSFSCSGSYAKQLYSEDEDFSTVEITGITSDINCRIKYQTKKIRVKADGINSKVTPEFQYVEYGEDAYFSAYGKSYDYKYAYNTCGAVLDETSEYPRYVLKEVTRPVSCTFAYVDPTAVRTYPVSAFSNNPAMGGVSPASQNVEENTTAVINVLPKDGYKYRGNDCNATYSESKLFVNNVNASIRCNVSFTPGTGGIQFVVSASVTNPEGGALYPVEQIVDEYNAASIILTPNAGYIYASNNCGASYDNGILRINSVNKNTSCKVTFQSKQRTVNVTASSSNEEYGSVYPRSQVINENSTVKLSISPKEGYAYYDNNCGGTFERTSNYSNYGSLIIQGVSKATNCIVYFDDISKLALIEVQLDDNTHGSLSASSKYVKIGSDVSFIVTSYAGYVYAGNDCGGKYSNGKFTLTSVKSSKKCTIKFKEDNSKYTVKVVSNNTEMGEVAPASRVVNSGDDAQFVIYPKQGYKYVSNTCGAELSGSNVLVLRSVSSGTTCTIKFDRE